MPSSDLSTNMARVKEKRPFHEPPWPTQFKYPEGLILRGTIIKATKTRIFKKARPPYACRIELILWDKRGGKERNIRFVYARKTKGKWRFASQTTWCFDVETTWAAIQEAQHLGFFGRV